MQQVNSTLFALNKDGSFQCWKVFIVGNQVVVEFGKVGGKKQQKVTTCEPQNSKHGLRPFPNGRNRFALDIVTIQASLNRKRTSPQCWHMMQLNVINQ